MGMVERKHRAGSPRGKQLTRMVAAGCAAMVLTSGAYQAAFGDHVDQFGHLIGHADYEEDEGVSAGEAAAIAAAALAGLAALGVLGGGFLGLAGGGDGCPQGQLLPNGDARILPPLPANCTITELCLAPENTRVDSGMCRVYDLRARCREDKRWYSVTGRSEASIEVRDIVPNTPVLKLEGSKNTFCVPITTPQTANGRSVVIRGTFAPGGNVAPMHAEARMLVRIPGRSAPPVSTPEEGQPRGNNQPEFNRDR